MKKSRIWAMAVTAILVGSIVVVVFGLQKDTPKQSALQGLQSTGPLKDAPAPWQDVIPANATKVECPPPYMFDLVLTNRTVLIHRGESLTLPITIDESGDAANITLKLVETTPEIAGLPQGINGTFDQPSLALAANSTTIVNLTISIGNRASPGTYALRVAGSQHTSKWDYDDAVPVVVTVS